MVAGSELRVSIVIVTNRARAQVLSGPVLVIVIEVSLLNDPAEK